MRNFSMRRWASARHGALGPHAGPGERVLGQGRWVDALAEVDDDDAANVELLALLAEMESDTELARVEVFFGDAGGEDLLPLVSGGGAAAGGGGPWGGVELEAEGCEPRAATGCAGGANPEGDEHRVAGSDGPGGGGGHRLDAIDRDVRGGNVHSQRVGKGDAVRRGNGNYRLR